VPRPRAVVALSSLGLSDQSKHRETSNKALGAVNNLALVPFLMSFLSSRDRLPIPTVTSAGASRSLDSVPRGESNAPSVVTAQQTQPNVCTS
jgi:hypothetical protein